MIEVHTFSSLQMHTPFDLAVSTSEIYLSDSSDGDKRNLSLSVVK